MRTSRAQGSIKVKMQRERAKDVLSFGSPTAARRMMRRGRVNTYASVSKVTGWPSVFIQEIVPRDGASVRSH